MPQSGYTSYPSAPVVRASALATERKAQMIKKEREEQAVSGVGATFDPSFEITTERVITQGTDSANSVLALYAEPNREWIIFENPSSNADSIGLGKNADQNITNPNKGSFPYTIAPGEELYLDGTEMGTGQWFCRDASNVTASVPVGMYLIVRRRVSR